MKQGKLDNSEEELLKSIENDEWASVDNLKSEKKRYQAIAKETFTKSKRINLRVTETDFHLAHVKARQEGIPYQTLLSSVIHKYLTGQFESK